MDTDVDLASAIGQDRHELCANNNNGIYHLADRNYPYFET